MPIYYKKVIPDGHHHQDVGLIESGLTTNGRSSGSGTGFFGFGGGSGSNSKKPFYNRSSSSNLSDVELDRISVTLHDESQAHYEFTSEHDNAELKFLESRASNADRDRLMTKYGPLCVVKQLNGHGTDVGSTSGSSTGTAAATRPVIITYHDVGLNYFSNFESFFMRMNMKQMLQDFRIYHINAPGQEESAEDLPPNYLFPTMDDLAEQLKEVCHYYNIQEFIGKFVLTETIVGMIVLVLVGFGYGAGCNVLSRFALGYSDMVEALFLINPSATVSTWSEWWYQKMNVRTLTNTLLAQQQAQQGTATSSGNGSKYRFQSTLPQSLQDYFMWHLFGNTSLPDRVLDEESMAFYRRYLASNHINMHNLAQFIQSYVSRSALGISREDRLNNFKVT